MQLNQLSKGKQNVNLISIINYSFLSPLELSFFNFTKLGWEYFSRLLANSNNLIFIEGIKFYQKIPLKIQYLMYAPLLEQ